MTIAEKIKIFGRYKFKNQKKFAEALNISPQNLNMYLSGKRNAGDVFLKRLASLGCDMQWLFDEKETEEYNPPDILLKIKEKDATIYELCEQINEMEKKILAIREEQIKYKSENEKLKENLQKLVLQSIQGDSRVKNKIKR